MKKVVLILFFLFLTVTSFGQISGIINHYTKVIAIDPACNKITVQSATNFAVGDTVLIIQMKGATINETHSNSYGNVENANSAGNYEFALITHIITNEIYIKHTLKPYNTDGLVQLVSVPQFTNVSITGTLTAKAWDGETGGVLVFEASGTVTLSANIDVSRLGFRGGAINPGSGDGCNSNSGLWYTPSSSTVTSGKGEGIAAFITNRESGKGKQANGGGGGHANNYGGAGGGNYGNGGRGGNQSSGCNSFLYPNNHYAIGGLGLTYSNTENKIFLGGGGGAGQQNNTFNGTGGLGTPGGRGGGIVIIKANEIIGNSKSIIASGQSITTPAIGDGAGGGGAGGTVLLSVASYNTSLTIDVSGGKGDNVSDGTGRNLGPGGGGGGGVIWVSSNPINGNITSTITGGASGTVTSTLCATGCVYGAAAGSTGGILTNLVLQKGSTIFNQTCVLPVQIINFTAKLYQDKVKLEWNSAMEKNNSYYTVEKTSDFVTYEVIETINGLTSSSSPVNYSAYDHTPSSGICYYRLSQTDLDGTTKVLGFRSIKNNQSDKLVKNVFPNPFQNNLKLEVNNRTTLTDLDIKIYNVLGELVYSIYMDEPSDIIELDLAELPAGIYSCTIQSENVLEILKIIKRDL